MEIGSNILGAVNDANKSFGHHFFFRPLVFFLGSRKSTKTKQVELSPGVLEKRFYHLKATLDDHFFLERSEEFLKELISTIEKLIWRLKNQRDAIKPACFAKALVEPNFFERKVGITIAYSTSSQHSFLGRDQIQEAIAHAIKGAEIIDDFFYDGKKGDDEIQSFYFEIQKRDRDTFKESDLKAIEDVFTYDLMDRITVFSYPMFLPRNEEEVMRYMLQLSREIKFVKDLPQVIIQFRNQNQQSLIFDLIFCKVRMDGDEHLSDRFIQETGDVTFRFERSRDMGDVRKKTLKDAYLFQVEVNLRSFLRKDLSVDLSKARQAVLEKIKKYLGPLRDFNGGILSKEKELLVKARYEILREKSLNEHLLENLYYSIQPYVMRTLVDSSCISDLYLLIDQNEIEENSFRFKERLDGVVAIMKSNELSRCQEIQSYLELEFKQGYDLGTLHLTNREGHFLGVIFLTAEKKQQEKFIQSFSNGINRIFQKAR